MVDYFRRKSAVDDQAEQSVPQIMRTLANVADLSDGVRSDATPDVVIWQSALDC